MDINLVKVMDAFFYLHSKFIWMILGIVMILLEMVLVSGMGCLFAGLGALTTVVVLEYQIIESKFVIELVVFLTSSVAWWFVLWYPIKLLKRDKESYQGLVGSVVTLSNDVKKGQKDSILWSGVRIRAALDKSENALLLKKGTKAKIKRIKGNVLYLIKED
ncbi:MAG: hypothetical protein HRU36_01050 [Rickettsiales bacterium]|nr:hypothetical protein [Rickettsiales bacterium]